MDTKSLRDQLAKLHGELGEALRVDPQSQELLSDMMQDINRLIDQPPRAPAARRPRRPRSLSLPGSLGKIAVQFEADHPTLAASARRLIDLLGEVGI